MEFHLPYVALRRENKKIDGRRIRSSEPMLGALNEQEDGILYEAQISFFVVGVDEWYWTATCLVETYFGSDESIQVYEELAMDGPSGGRNSSSQVVWNPREYFLLVFAARMAQITMEWHNIVSALDVKLDIHVGLSE